MASCLGTGRHTRQREGGDLGHLASLPAVTRRLRGGSPAAGTGVGHLDELAGPPEPNPAAPGRRGTRGSGWCGLETGVHETKLERRKIRACAAGPGQERTCEPGTVDVA